MEGGVGFGREASSEDREMIPIVNAGNAKANNAAKKGSNALFSNRAVLG